MSKLGAQRAILAPLEEQGRLLNIYRTLARHPTLLEAWARLGAGSAEPAIPPGEQRAWLAPLPVAGAVSGGSD